MSNRYGHYTRTLTAGTLLLVALAAATVARADDPAAAPSEQTPSKTELTTAPAASHPASQPADLPEMPNRKLFGEGGIVRDSDDGDGKGPGAMLAQMLAMVGIVAALGIGCWYVYRRLLPKVRMSKGGKRVQVVETTYLNPRQSVHLLRVGQRLLLVSSSRDGVQMLSDVTDGMSEDSDFAKVLEKTQADGGDA